MKLWRVWITGYPGSVVEIEEGVPMSAITAMAWAARALKAHHHGEIIEMNACSFNEADETFSSITSKHVRIFRGGALELM